MNSPKYKNDQPTLVDLSLGTINLVKKLSAEIANSNPPKTFAITGYWGAGKTSALAMLYQELIKRPPPIFKDSATDYSSGATSDYFGIWFEAWKYQNENQPIIALLQTIKKSFSTTTKVIDATGKLASVSMLGALTVLDGVIKSATGMSGISKIKNIGEGYEKENLLSRLSSDHINDALRQAVDTLLQVNAGKNKKLVIFVDDLDRCEPEAIHNLLEGLKLFLTIENCVVVMAIDSHQIEQSLLKKIGENAIKNNKFYGVEYLEKICQDSYRLPVPNKMQSITFLGDNLNFSMSNAEPEKNNYITDLKKVLHKYECLAANPRRLKLLSNRITSLLTYVELDSLKKLKEHSEKSGISGEKCNRLFVVGIFIVASLNVNYRRIYERLEQSPNFISELIEFCNSKGNEAWIQIISA